MGRCKDLTSTEKQVIVTHLKNGMFLQQISKMLKKAADKIIPKRKRNKRKSFKDISDRNVRQLKTIMVNGA